MDLTLKHLRRNRINSNNFKVLALQFSSSARQEPTVLSHNPRQTTNNCLSQSKKAFKTLGKT